MMRVW